MAGRTGVYLRLDLRWAAIPRNLGMDESLRTLLLRERASRHCTREMVQSRGGASCARDSRTNKQTGEPLLESLASNVGMGLYTAVSVGLAVLAKTAAWLPRIAWDAAHMQVSKSNIVMLILAGCSWAYIFGRVTRLVFIIGFAALLLAIPVGVLLFAIAFFTGWKPSFSFRQSVSDLGLESAEDRMWQHAPTNACMVWNGLAKVGDMQAVQAKCGIKNAEKSSQDAKQRYEQFIAAQTENRVKAKAVYNSLNAGFVPMAKPVEDPGARGIWTGPMLCTDGNSQQLRLVLKDVEAERLRAYCSTGHNGVQTTSLT